MLALKITRLLSYRTITSPVRCSSSISELKELCQRKNESFKTAGIFKKDKVVVTGTEGPRIQAEGYKGDILNFCSCDSYGLAFHPKLKEAASKSIEKFGLGLCAPRYACGTQDVHKQLEAKIAQFHDRDDAIVYPSCYHANIGLFNALFGPEDVVISDQFNHASIISGLQLSKCKKAVFKHKDMEHLESVLKQFQNARFKVIATDGVFSLLGTIAPLRDICTLAEKYNCLIFLDECHATAVMGKNGRGTEEYFGLQGKVDIINSTIGKSLGVGMGGYTTGQSDLIDFLRQQSKPFRFTKTLPPSIAAAGCTALDIMMSKEGAELLEKLYLNVRHFKKEMGEAGFAINQADETPIVAVTLGNEQITVDFAHELLEKGVFAGVGITEPAVPKGEAFLRVQISALHDVEDINECINVFCTLGKAKGLI